MVRRTVIVGRRDPGRPPAGVARGDSGESTGSVIARVAQASVAVRRSQTFQAVAFSSMVYEALGSGPTSISKRA
jgi:hypothetical protein